MKEILKKPAGKREDDEIEILTKTLAEAKFFLERQGQLKLNDIRELSAYLRLTEM